MVSGYFLFVPSESFYLADGSIKVSDTYFLVFMLLFYLGFTAFEIPHQSWGAELSTSPEAKNSLFSWRAGGILLGSLLFYTVPFLPVFEKNEFTPETIRHTKVRSQKYFSCLERYTLKHFLSHLAYSTIIKRSL